MRRKPQTGSTRPRNCATNRSRTKGNRYVPYAGCQEESVASLGGLFPYPLFDKTNERQRNAVYHFVANGKASGNMYPVGKSVCAWYAGWMAAALAALGDQTEPFKLLDKAAEGAGCFGEIVRDQ